jgi:hypothetical protein
MLDFLWSLDSHGMVGDADGEHLSRKSKCHEKIKQDTLIAWVTIHVTRMSHVCVTLCQTSSVRLDICAGCAGVCGTGVVKVVLKGNRSKGLRPQLVRCAPFPSIAPYFRVL